MEEEWREVHHGGILEEGGWFGGCSYGLFRTARRPGEEQGENVCSLAREACVRVGPGQLTPVRGEKKGTISNMLKIMCLSIPLTHVVERREQAYDPHLYMWCQIACMTAAHRSPPTLLTCLACANIQAMPAYTCLARERMHDAPCSH